MAGGRKRASDDAGPTTRASKSAKTDSSAAAKASKGGRKAGKAAIPASAFKAKALPLHINLTHTPPTIPDEESVPAASADPGFISAFSLVPSTFNTGSYGWKGNKRISVELQNPEGEEKEKVQVILTINATVVGSKQAKGEQEETKEEEPHDDVATAEVEADGEANGDVENKVVEET